MTQKQLAEKIGASEFLVQDLEKGVLPKNYQPVIKAIEKILDINVIKIPENNKIITRSPVSRPAEAEENADKKPGFFSRIFGRKKVTQEQINEIIEKENIEPTVTKKEEIKKKEEKIVEITPSMKLHKKKDVTLNDLIDAKREKDKLNIQKNKKEIKDMTGKDIELDE
jgi:ribosomal protein L17